jgi:glutamate racemase
VIALFDSGVGGLSVAVEVRRLLPTADLIYLADRERAPYGERSLQEVRRYAAGITAALLSQGARLVVVACNTASAAALTELRHLHPEVPFVGMEPAVKPAAVVTRRGAIGVLATPATFQGELYASVVERFAVGRRVIPVACPGLADLVERGVLEGVEAEELVRRYVEPLVQAGVDTLVLACTHYPFLLPLIRRVAGPELIVIDPTPAVARRVAQVASDAGVAAGDGTLRFLASGELSGLADLVTTLTGWEVEPERFHLSPYSSLR